MANTDEAKETTPTSVSDIQNAVETAGSEDESVDNDQEQVEEKDHKAEAGDNAGEESTDEATEEESTEGKSEEDESKSESEEDESKPSDKKDSEYRFSQFAGDGKPETYISNLEKAYKESSAQGVRLNQELKQAQSRVDSIMRAVGGDPDLAEKLHKILSGDTSAATSAQSSQTKDPFLVNAETQWRTQSEKEAQEFIDANPEVVSNPDLNSEVKHWMEIISHDEYNRNGRLMTAGEAMAKAYKYLGHEDKREQRKSMNDAKKAAASTRPQGSRKPAPKTGGEFTDSQLAFAEQMGFSKDKLEKFAK